MKNGKILTWRMRVWEIIEAATPGDKTSRTFDIFILTLIALNVVAVVLGIVDSVAARFGQILERFEVLSVCVFTVEYAARLWSCSASSAYMRPVVGRLAFAARASSLVDLLAILPFYLPFLGLDLRFLRVVRLIRIFRIAKIGRYYSSLRLIKNVLILKKEELVLATVVMSFLLLISAALLYHCEHDAQPEAFSDIPTAMWWAVITLTTVGYGDVYPVTVWGKCLASIIAVLGIGMFALPTGILGAGFVEEIAKRKSEDPQCPHCGKAL